MSIPQLNVYRNDHADHTQITLAGEIDLSSAPVVRAALAACARDGVRKVDVDLTAVTFCDASGLNVFLEAFQLATRAGTVLQLHYPPPVMARVIEITGSGFLLHRLHAVRPARSLRGGIPAALRGAP